MSLTQKELDYSLLRVGEDGEPFNHLEMRAIKNSLWGKYKNPEDYIVNDAYLNESFAQGLYGTPDRLKQGFGMQAGIDPGTGQRYTDHVYKSESMPIVADKISEIVHNNNGVPFGGIHNKDVLSTSTTGDTGGGVLINQQVIPQLSVWFYDEFKAMSRLPRTQATGLDYEWNNLIALSDENEGFLDENGCPVSAASVYFRGRTNIALVGVTRGTNLKLDLAIRAGGVLYNGGMSSYELEMKSALTVRARLLEKAFFQGVTAGGHGLGTGQTWDEWGQSFVNGYNGWRVLTSGQANLAHPNFYPNPYLPIIVEQDIAGAGSIVDATEKAAIAIRNRGGKPTALYCSFDAARRIRGELQQYIRYVPTNLAAPPGGEGAPYLGSDLPSGGIVVGGHVAAIDTAVGLIPIIGVPDDSIGKYPTASIGTPTMNGFTFPATGLSSTFTQDMYLASEGDLSLPYLGSPDPIPLELPMGISDINGNGCFQRRFIIYLFMGFAMHVPVHQAKIRIPSL